jgi:hypothetical protein
MGRPKTQKPAPDNVTPIRKGEVDGQPALIDGTVPKPDPIFQRPTLEEAIDSLRTAFVDLDEAKRVHAAANEELTKAKKAVENRARYVVELSADSKQLSFGDTPDAIRAMFEGKGIKDAVDDFDTTNEPDDDGDE